MGFEHGQGREHGVEVLQGGFAGSEEVFEEVGRDVGVEPKETGLAVVDEVRPALFDAGKRGADRGGNDEVAGLRRRKARVGSEGVQGDDTRVEEK